MPDTPTPKAQSYPGRPALDAANARFRRALARLQREGARHDQALLPQLAAIVGEATEHLLRLAGDAEAAESTSARHRAALSHEEEKLNRILRKAARQGHPIGDLMAAQDARRRKAGGPQGDGAA